MAHDRVAPAARLSARGGAHQARLRAHNLAAALREVVDAPEPTTRARIAARLGLTRATASDLVEALIGAGLVVELAPEVLGRAGRPGMLLAPGTRAVVGLGLEVQVDHLAVRATDLTGAAVAEAHRPGDYRGSSPATVARQLARLAAPILEGLAGAGGPEEAHEAAGAGHPSMAPVGAGLPDSPSAAARGTAVAGVCVSVPALLQRGSGVVHLAPNLGWHDVDLVSLLARQEALHGLPIQLGNDADLSARAETRARTRSAGHQPDDLGFLYVAGEVGIGGAIVVGGELSGGQHGWSGEIGHAVVDRSGPLCGCGAHGCLETYAGRDAIMAAARLPLDTPVDVLVEQARRRGAARRALDRAADAIGVAVATALNLVDVERVVLGGVYGTLFDELADGIRAQVAARVLAARWSEVDVSRALAGPDAAVTGAGLRVLDDVVRDPAAWMARQR